MKHRKTRIAIASAVCLWGAPFASATPTFYIDYGNNGSIEVVIADGSALDMAATVTGVVSGLNVTAVIPIITLTTVTGTTKPILGSAIRPSLQETAMEVNGHGAVAVYFTESGFGPTGQSYCAQFSITSLSGTGLIDYYTYASTTAFDGSLASMAYYGGLTPMTSSSLSALGATATGGSLPFPGSTTTGFSLTQKVIFNLPASGGSAGVTANLCVPDGGTTLSLLGCSMLGLGAIRRKLFKV
jgi:hypothetical protein